MSKELVDKIKAEEGFVPRLYYCTSEKPTIGYGFNLADRDMPEPVAAYWLELELHDLSRQLNKYEFFRDLDEVRRIVVTDMAYNMGVPRLMGFGQMIIAIKAKDWEKAAIELMDSAYGRGPTKNRANRNAEIMRMGKL